MSKSKSSISSIRIVRNFFKIAWSGSVLRVLNHAFDDPLKPEECAAMPLAGGIMQHGYQCGMIWGAALAAGARAYRLLGPGPQAEAASIIAAQRVVESFRALNKNVNCIDITGIDRSSSAMQMTIHFFIKGGTIECFRMASKYAPAAYSEINSALSGKQFKEPDSQVSCSAMLARKMGVSDMHVVMASGLAGGIGLSGGACGALGAAIWIIGMNRLKEGAVKVDYNDPRGIDAINRFLKCAGYEFECSKIVGREFEDVRDHSAYVRDGGCAKIIEALASGR